MRTERTARRRPGRGLPSWAGAWAADSLVLVLANVTATVFTSVAAVLIARELPPTHWATFAALLGLAVAFGVFVDFGMSTWLLREFSRVAGSQYSLTNDPAGHLLGAVVAFALGSVAVLMVGSAAVTLLLGRSVSEMLTLVCFVLFIGVGAVASAFEARLRSFRRVGRVSVANISEKGVLLVSVATAALVLNPPPLLLLAGMYPIAAMVRLGLVVRVAMVGVKLVSPALSFIREVIGKSIPFALTSVGLNVIPRLDALVLVGLSSTSAAYLALGDRVLGPALILPVILSVTLFPFVARHRQVGWTLVVVVGGVGVCVAAIGIFLAPSVIPWLFGEKYTDAVRPIQVLMLSLPFIYASNILVTYVYSAGRERIALVGTITVALFGTGLIFLGQVIGGPDLAATGSVLRQVMFFAVLVVIARGLVSGDEGTPDAPAALQVN